MTQQPDQPDSPAAELRAAARLLRETAAAAGGLPWEAAHHPEGTIVQPTGSTRSIFRVRAAGRGEAGTPHVTPEIGAWIALMHPGVGEALAAWLDREAAIWEALETAKLELHPKGFKLSWGIDTHAEALATARALLGTAR